MKLSGEAFTVTDEATGTAGKRDFNLESARRFRAVFAGCSEDLQEDFYDRVLHEAK